MNRLLVAAAAVLFPALCGGCEGASIGGSGAEAADAAEVAGTADASMPISESALVDSGAELPEEICDGQDNDQDGEVDEGCICEVGLKQSCFVGDTAKQGVGACNFGTQTCIPEDEFSRWGACTGSGAPQNEICDNEIDDDCNGAIDDGPDCNMPIILEVDISIDGDCITANCPAVAPYPVGCEIRFAGGDSRGCVASSPGNPVVYFQEGNDCGSGSVVGTLKCSSEAGSPLDASSCNIDKQTSIYVTNKNECPD